VGNLTMTAYVAVSTGGIGSLSNLAFQSYDGSGQTSSLPVAWGDTLNSRVGQYWPYSFTFPAGTQATYVSIVLGAGTSWVGTIYIDSVQIAP
jgi:hypothetical protein